MRLYSNHWSVIVDYREALRAELGDERFDALWEEGKLLDEKTVRKQLFEEFASDS